MHGPNARFRPRSQHSFAPRYQSSCFGLLSLDSLFLILLVSTTELCLFVTYLLLCHWASPSFLSSSLSFLFPPPGFLSPPPSFLFAFEVHHSATGGHVHYKHPPKGFQLLQCVLS